MMMMIMMSEGEDELSKVKMSCLAPFIGTEIRTTQSNEQLNYRMCNHKQSQRSHVILYVQKALCYLWVT